MLPPRFRARLPKNIPGRDYVNYRSKVELQKQSFNYRSKASITEAKLSYRSNHPNDHVNRLFSAGVDAAFSNVLVASIGQEHGSIFELYNIITNKIASRNVIGLLGVIATRLVTAIS